ncbi:MAG: sulfite exporter TauE/SafE family protein [Clostridia bacterium]|nr:sulfite exporter TauE/SafE family protein [Clostridia bacterium]
MNPLWGIVVGVATGVISGMGVGGGSLLLVWLTAAVGMEPYQAGVINLAYFLTCAPTALWQHQKNGLVQWRAVGWSLLGLPLCVGAALLASHMDPEWLRRLFGGLLLAVAWKELRTKE